MPIANLQTHGAPYVTVADLCAYFEVSRQTVHKWIASGVLVVVRLPGRAVRVTTISARRLEAETARASRIM